MSRIFTIDIGNTAAKGTVFEDDRVLISRVVDNTDPDALFSIASEYKAEGAIFCSVRGVDEDFGSRLRSELDIPAMALTSGTPLPFKVVYSTPDTLGVDRIAAAAGAIYKYGEDVFVVDVGTAVTTDVVSRREYLGGNISPGLRLRFRSLNAFTAKLPLVRPDGEFPEWGHDTETAIRCGVVGGLVSEIACAFFEIKNKFNDIRLVMTGGDADFIKPLLEKRGVDCCLDHNLVGLGLASIYNFNRK